MDTSPTITPIDAAEPLSAKTYGERAKCLQHLVELGLRVPRSVALSFGTVRAITEDRMPDLEGILHLFEPDGLLCVRPSPENPDWGGPSAMLNIGITKSGTLVRKLGKTATSELTMRFVQAYAIHVAKLDPDWFDEKTAQNSCALSAMLRAYEEETEESFPFDAKTQLAGVLRSMARAWEGTSARLLRQAKGASPEAGLGLVVQQMIPGLGRGECGSGVVQLADSATGFPKVTGRYLAQSQGREALGQSSGAMYLARDPRGDSLENAAPEAYAELTKCATLMRERLQEEMQLEFVLQDRKVHILDGARAPRSPRAELRMAVRLAEDGIITPQEAILRIKPQTLTMLLHRQVDPIAPRDVLGRGIAASPGAAAGRIVFTSVDAQSAASRREACVLVRRETTPEDIRGMHAASAVLTERGGTTSHAAVIGRGLGLPCVVGASQMRVEPTAGRIIAADGRILKTGDMITIDGTTGEVLVGSPPLLEAQVDDAFRKLMYWADAARDLGIRANADTPTDAEVARTFNAQGIGLCRTEHMFFETGRLVLMREMIFAESSRGRAAILERLLPMQRDDFAQLFRIMQGRPVCIRLFDLPLHEFLPTTQAGRRELAEALDLPLRQVTKRVQELAEYNPMLGLRGVRLGVTVPEIYDMQARAIFEATIEASREGDSVVPEIMLPLVSARREVELVKARIDAVAAEVRRERHREFDYRLGVMVETPRAALKAGEIAPLTAFLSFGTNDLTQMAYGMSRDDAGRFMPNYIRKGVLPEDPFHVIDIDGVGELLRIGVERGRKTNPHVTVSVCGEHGGNPQSIAFCREAGMDYVSCSPFRVPVARLVAAQLAIESNQFGTTC